MGAFKCGTTALYDYLRQHPQVYLPFHKEPLFFGDDLTRRYGRMTEAEYLALFRDARPGQRIGEASAWYLYSTSAAREIKAFSPEASIIAMVRNPIDVMYAEHSQLIFNVEEDILDFAEALEA
ncbi:MAG TPA: sulfotransferase, partial [Candidatus Limnocylindria bacterium]